MPTGYTADVAKGKLTTREYILSCSRAFGAMVHMKDDAHDTPFKMREESTYYTKRLQELNEELNMIVGISASDAWALMQQEYADAMKYYEERLAEDAETVKNYGQMLIQVERWNPPTPEHVGLKEFAIQQLRDSIQFDSYAHDKPTRSSDPSKWLQNKINRITKDIKYHTEEQEKEQKRVADTNAWITSLMEALPR